MNPTKQHSMKCPKLHGKECTCDGYHTFDELYAHRVQLFIVICRKVFFEDKLSEEMKKFREGFSYKPTKIPKVWKSKTHHDGTTWDGWFIMGINTKKGEQISYHLPDSLWDSLDYIKTLESAPEWDGHTSDDVLERLTLI
jgi:hypothetical protein